MASHPSRTSMTALNMSRLCIPSVIPLHWLVTQEITKLMELQEGSRIYTPVRLGFPRQTLDGASYNGQKIPKDMVCTSLHVVTVITFVSKML